MAVLCSTRRPTATTTRSDSSSSPRVTSAATIHAPVRLDALRHVLPEELSGVERAGPWVFSAAWLAELEEDLRARMSSADPIDPGVPVPSAPWAADVLPLLPLERRGSRLYLPGSTPTLEGRSADADALAAELVEAGMRATKVDDEKLARFLEAGGRLVRLGEGYVVGAEAFGIARDVVLVECAAEGGITLARFRDLVGTGRRDAQLLLERLDADGITRRDGERRVLRRDAARAH